MNTERSSGTYARPRLARRCSGARVASTLPEDLARQRRERAGERLERRGLARAVRAEQRDDLAGVEVEIDLAHRGEAAVARREVPRLEQHARRDRLLGPDAFAGAFRARRGVRRGLVVGGLGLTEVGRDHGRVGADLVGSARRDHAPEVERDDAVAHRHDQRDVVLDEKDRETPLLGQAAHETHRARPSRARRGRPRARRGAAPTASSRRRARCRRAGAGRTAAHRAGGRGRPRGRTRAPRRRPCSTAAGHPARPGR